MKKIYLVLILFSFLFLTGCTCEFNLTIDDKKRVYEDITLFDSNDNILKQYNSVEQFLYEQGSQFDNYEITELYENEKSGLNLKRNYKTIDEYIADSNYTRAFQKAYIVNKDNFFQFETTGEYYRNNVFSIPLESIYKYNVDEVKINIKFYNVVLSHNADKVDEKNNIYTWIIDYDKLHESISFQLSNDVRHDVMFSDFFKRHGLLLIVIGVVVIVILTVVINFKRKIDANNRI